MSEVDKSVTREEDQDKHNFLFLYLFDTTESELRERSRAPGSVKKVCFTTRCFTQHTKEILQSPYEPL